MAAALDQSLTLPSGLVLPNRIAKAAMTEGLATLSGTPSAALMRLYETWSASGAGLLITGNVGLDANHPVRPRDVILTRGTPMAPFKEWARLARANGARVVMQLNHAGRQTPRFVNSRPLGPSAGTAVKVLHAFGDSREATEGEILEIVKRHAEAAAFAQEAGFDGVQVHAAHGYLINQFLSPDVNRRNDSWGGDIEGRARLLIECVRAVRAATGRKFTVMVKLNSGDFLRGGFTEEESLKVVQLLNEASVDLLEVSGGRYESGASFGYASNAGAREAYFLEFARQARAIGTMPLMLTGGLRSKSAMQAALSEGALDVVGIARPMVLHTDYPRRLLAGEVLPPVSAPRLGLRSLASLEAAAEMSWYYRQLARLGGGLSPSTTLGAFRALAAFFAGDTIEAFRHRLRNLLPSSSARALPPASLA